MSKHTLQSLMKSPLVIDMAGKQLVSVKQLALTILGQLAQGYTFDIAVMRSSYYLRHGKQIGE